MAAPTVTFEGVSAFNNTTAAESVAGVAWGAGDIILVLGMTEDQGVTFATPTATGLTFSALAGIPTTTVNSCKGYAWSATAGSASSATVSATKSSATNMGGIIVWSIAGSSGLGTPAILTNTTDLVSVTRAVANSCVAWIGGDWGATNDLVVTPSPAGGTQRQAKRISPVATMFGFDWPDQGAAGTTSYGITGFTTASNFTKIAVEMKGSAGGGGATVKNLAALGVG